MSGGRGQEAEGQGEDRTDGATGETTGETAGGVDALWLFQYPRHMHEMSVATSLLDIVREELGKHEVEKLLLVRVRYGALANLVPEALEFAFEVLTTGTDFEGARIELVQNPVRLACGGCGREFEPEGRELLFSPCPACGEEVGHTVLSGRDLYVEHIEAE
ncbi:hypothetical protein DDE01_19450 [Desulfovibrio desulfuricans]|nr:hydrogenase expression/synthesis HypA [Nitratidesulfovibrio vulgaris RCH1]GEB80530.1 hypothetical protein DDE01_19450 [Desulfovibrio desulfuricans]